MSLSVSRGAALACESVRFCPTLGAWPAALRDTVRERRQKRTSERWGR